MILPQFVTFTGVDIRTDVDKMFELHSKYPIEWGVLFGDKRNGNRYMSTDDIDALIEIQLAHASNKLMLSAHLCGTYSKDARNGIITGLVTRDWFQRIQVNAIQYDDAMLGALHAHTGCSVIKQHRTLTFPDTPVGVFNLFDKSGGKGEVAKSVPQYEGDNFVGYAGGITPDNVKDFMSKIVSPNYWLDMESGIRTDDWLDLDKCEAVCKAIWE